MRLHGSMSLITTTCFLSLSFRHPGASFVLRAVTSSGRSFGDFNRHDAQQHPHRSSVRLASSGSGTYDKDINNSINNSNINEDIPILSSLKSTTVKRMQALLSKSKKRMEYGQTVVEGPRIIFDLLQNPQTRSLVQEVLISSDHLEYYHQLMNDMDSNIRIQLGTPQVVQACCDTVTPQGMVATVKLPPYYYHQDKDEMSTLLSNILRDSSSSKHHGLFLILDGLSDPGNLGTLLRTSVAVGVTAVLLLPQCCDPYSPKALRSAMGTTFLLPILSFDSWRTCHEQLLQLRAMTMQRQEEPSIKTDLDDDNTSQKNNDSPNMIWAATMIEEEDAESSAVLPSLPYYQVDWTITSTSLSPACFLPKALVIGGEGNGLSSNVRQALADGSIRAVHVPMEPGIESLNAAVCGSIIMFEAYRQQQ